jgi:hypothetical protein
MLLGGNGRGLASPMIGEESVVDLTRNEALQAADNVSFAETLCAATIKSAA